jgi:CPA2 family monovalent cation:H+ antiporter-2
LTWPFRIRRAAEDGPAGRLDDVTLAELALTVALLGVLGLVASRVGLSAIPAYLLAGLLLGPNEPKALSLVHPSEVTHFLSELGIVFLLFFLGLEFSLDRVLRSGRHVGAGGLIDLAVNALLGLAVGVVAFGFGFAALVVAAAVYVSSSAVAVKGLIDLRRLADDETDLVLAILVFEDVVIGIVLGLVAGGGGSVSSTLWVALKALVFITGALAASRFLAKPIDRLLAWLPREFFLLSTVAFVVGASAAAKSLGLSEAIGALMAGVVLAETSARREIEERFLGFRDLFAALFFFVFGLSIDVGELGRVGWLVALAVAVSVAGKLATGLGAGRIGGFTARQSLNVGAALVARGEFTVVLAQVAAGNAALALADRSRLTAFAGLYVLGMATIGVILMKESKRLGRRLFPLRTLRSKEAA